MTLAEFAAWYHRNYVSTPLSAPTDKRVTTILYPGSNSDSTPLEIGFQLLHRSSMDTVRFIYTEIGEYEQELPVWHEGIADLDGKIKEGLGTLVKTGLVQKIRTSIRDDHPWKRHDVPNSGVIEYELDVPVGGKIKKLTLILGYNTFENRPEPTAEEKQTFSPTLIAKARENYWPLPTEEGKIYPTYFNQDQFDQADIILSKQCGDFGLLQFDYVRALHHTNQRKPRVILTENPEGLPAVQVSLPQYKTEVVPLRNTQYGYCHSDCKVGILAVKP